MATTNMNCVVLDSHLATRVRGMASAASAPFRGVPTLQFVTSAAPRQDFVPSRPFAKVPTVGCSAGAIIDRTKSLLDCLVDRGPSDDNGIQVQAKFPRQGG